MQKSDKLAVLKGILNGTISFEHLRPPQHYMVIKDGTGYRTTFNDKPMSEDEYTAWKAKTVRPIDTLILFVEDKMYNEPIASEIDPQPVCVDQNEQETTSIIDPVEVVENAVYDEIPQPIAEHVEPAEPVELFAIPVKRGGKLSEYGETWRLSKFDEN